MNDRTSEQRRKLGRLLALAIWFAVLSLPVSRSTAAAEGGAALPNDAAASTRARSDVDARIFQRVAFAEQAHASGRYAAGLEAIDEALILAIKIESPLRIGMVRLVRAGLLAAKGDGGRARQEWRSILDEADALDAPELVGAARINLANSLAAAGQTQAALSEYAIAEASASARGAEERGAAELLAQASVNRLRAEIQAANVGGRSFPAEAIAQSALPIESLVQSLDDPELSGRLSLHLGVSLKDVAALSSRDAGRILLQANRLLRLALDNALLREDAALQVESLGQLGALYEIEGRNQEAHVLTGRAIAQGARIGNETALFPWWLQRARLESRLGLAGDALKSEARAMDLVESNREAIVSYLDSSKSRTLGQAGAGEQIAQLYRRHVDHLLVKARNADSEEERRRDLVMAQSMLERLKGNELQDYFEDDCVIRYRERLQSVESTRFDAMILYPFVLDERLELLAYVGGRRVQFVVDVPRAELVEEVERFRSLLEKRSTRQYLRPAKRLYDWLIGPLEPLLEETKPETLVIIPDGILRTIPIAALHDGSRFLIERIALGLTPGLELTDPQPISPSGRNALIAGLSESIAGFAALPSVAREVSETQVLLGGQVLLNAQFSRRALGEELRDQRLGIVHIASHAVLGDEASEGYVLTHDGPFELSALADAIGASKFREKPLELLTLSACETAGGTERAALGLSGVAVQAGAQSAMGSLWSVNDEATAEFMQAFYGALRGEGNSRAEAIRHAQQHILAIPAYRHPYYWSPFLLINSWL